MDSDEDFLTACAGISRERKGVCGREIGVSSGP